MSASTRSVRGEHTHTNRRVAMRTDSASTCPVRDSSFRERLRSSFLSSGIASFIARSNSSRVIVIFCLSPAALASSALAADPAVLEIDATVVLAEPALELALRSSASRVMGRVRARENIASGGGGVRGVFVRGRRFPGGGTVRADSGPGRAERPRTGGAEAGHEDSVAPRRGRAWAALRPRKDSDRVPRALGSGAEEDTQGTPGPAQLPTSSPRAPGSKGTTGPRRNTH